VTPHLYDHGPAWRQPERASVKTDWALPDLGHVQISVPICIETLKHGSASGLRFLLVDPAVVI